MCARLFSYRADDSGSGSLRAALEGAALLPGGATISFAQLDNGGPNRVITLRSGLNITGRVVLDGGTHPGTKSNSNGLTIDGSLASGYSAGLYVAAGADDTVIRRLNIAGFQSGACIALESDRAFVTGCDLSGCVVGVDARGGRGHTIENSHIHDNAGDGIKVCGAGPSRRAGGSHKEGEGEQAQMPRNAIIHVCLWLALVASGDSWDRR